MAHSVAPARARRSLLLLSGHNRAHLEGVASDFAAWLTRLPRDAAAAWPDVCAAAAFDRPGLPARIALAAASADEAAALLQAFGAGQPAAPLATGCSAAGDQRRSRVAFVYSGNGPQWWAMGRELLDVNPAFRAELEAVDAILSVRTGWSVIAELQRPENLSRMHLIEVAQPCLFALQLGLTAMLRTAGITPDTVLGHSVGEVAAAHVSRALSRAQAVEVILQCSLAQGRTAGSGRMAALGIGPDQARAAIDATDGSLELAAINAPRAVTIAGERAALARLIDRLTADGCSSRMLDLNYAFHSRAMDPIRDDLLTRLDGLAPRETELPFISTVAGRGLPGTALGAEYWWRNIRQPVHFAEAVDHALRAGVTTFVEVGPHPVLSAYIQQCARSAGVVASVVPTLRRRGAGRPPTEEDAIWQTLCACHAQGGGRLEALLTRSPGPVALPPVRAIVAIPSPMPPTQPAYRLTPVPGGGIDAFAWREYQRRPPGAGEVEIRVHAAGLNPQDVACALGAHALGSAPGRLGLECAGEVVAVGQGVDRFVPGHRVMGFAAGSFASHVMAQDAAMKGIPDGLSYVEAATIPLAFLTAAYALDHLARLRPAERVLIHGAAGGVGLAAVQLAQQRGAQVLATAGSQQKRCLLHQLGAGHPLRDHQADLVDAVLRVTGGQGVHVLLSALAGAQMVDNLRSLRPFGRYLQVGCHDLDATVAPLPYRSNLSYFGIDMEAVLTHRMEVAGLLFKAVVKQFDAGLLRPLPCISVPVARAADGFRRLLRYRPIGKIVLTMATEPSGRRSSPADDVRAVEIAAE